MCSKDPQRLCLGIDLGTTSVKICITNKQTHNVIFSISKPSHADVSSDIGTKGSEQDPYAILKTLWECLNTVPTSQLELVETVCVTGQMHGVMLWSSESVKNNFIGQFERPNSKHTSNIYTWQDQRCSSEFLSKLPKPDSHLPLASGYGCVTLLWLHQHQPKMLNSEFDCSGTVMDYLVSGLCGLAKPVTSAQLAASWGYFNTREKSWNYSQLTGAGLPMNLLPYVVCPGHRAGELQHNWFGIKPGTPVLAALGDVQCAVYSVLKTPQDAVLNMSTSCQLAFAVNNEELVPFEADKTCPVQYFPYFEESYLAIAASLNGGNVLAHFVSMLKQWLTCFDCHIEEDNIWDTLKKVSKDTADSDSLTIVPTLFGERHNPQQTGSASGFNTNNLDLGTVFRSLCKGLIDNLSNMMSDSFLKKHGITTLIGSGSLLSRNEIIRQEVAKHYGFLTVEFGNSCDSATGAAMFASKHCNETTT